jgi:hypothetical protein
MTKIVMVISCFEKAEEMRKFYQSIDEADLTYVPRITIINTDPENSLTGEKSIEVAQYFKRQEDRVFVSHKNLYMSAYRYVIQKYATNYDFLIGTEADIWFEKPLRFGDNIKYFLSQKDVAAIACLARYQTERQNDRWFKRIGQWEHRDGYLEAPGSIPWHMCLTRVPHVLGFFKTGWELIDTPFTNYCRKDGRKVLTWDCRDYCVHFDYHATIEKYPDYAKLCGIKYFSTKQRQVEDKDIEEI